MTEAVTCQFGMIREKATCHCPITAVYQQETGQRLDVNQVRKAAELLGLNDSFAVRVIDAADYTSRWLTPKTQVVRGKLLSIIRGEAHGEAE